MRPSSGPAGWDKVCALGVMRLLSQSNARDTVFELRLCQARQCDLHCWVCSAFLHRSVARDTVRKHVLFLRAGAGRFGLFLAFFVMRISRPDKAGGLVRPCPPALHRLARAVRARRQMFVLQPSLGTCGSGACRGAVSFWVRSGTFSELFWDFYVRRVKKLGHILVQFRDLPSEGFWLRGVKVGFFCHQSSFVTAS